MRKYLFVISAIVFLFCNITTIHAEGNSWQDEIIYFIMIDRFANGDQSNDYEVDVTDPTAFHGGDFQGIIDHLDYIKGMGFTAIWLTPIVKNEPKGYHGYWTEDFYEVEEHFGTLDKFKSLVQEAHARDIKVILDLVVNHTGYQHPWLDDPEKQDWFHEDQAIFDWNNQEIVENGRLAGLPDLAQENPEVREYLLEMAKWWIDETDVDGYRLDTVKHVPKDFWEDFVQEVKLVKDDFFLIGEVWHHDPAYVADYASTGIDSFVDYPYFHEITRIFSRPNQRIGRYMNGIWERNQSLYENPYILGNFLDNHDNKRFARLAIENGEDPVTRLKLALTYLYTSPGIPIVYYGTEIAMDGGDDPDNRRMMEFSDHELVSYISTLGELRQEHPALTRGEMKIIVDTVGATIFMRSLDDEQILVAINNTAEDQEIILPEDSLTENLQLTPVFGEEVVLSGETGYVLKLSGETSEIYLVDEIVEVEDSGIRYIYFILFGVVMIGLGGLFLFRKRGKA